MKRKNIVVLAAIITLTVFTACGNGNSNVQSELESLKAENESLKAENESLKEEQTAEITSEEITEITIEETTEETTAKNTDTSWKIEYFVDEFNRSTDEPYVVGLFRGNFSNSATTKSSLTVQIFMQRFKNDDKVTDGLGIELFEYDTHLVKNPYSKGKFYNIQILEENDNIINEQGYMSSNGNTIWVWGDENKNTVINAIQNNGVLTFRIDEEDGMDTYLFDVDCSGFKEIYESVDWKI